ncbi:MAG: hypothetical protein IJZ73_03495 [Clostridia bacterium]|nr:hypothetical protein [Clostridia bacterium]
MTEVFAKQDLISAEKQRKKVLIIYFITLAVFLVASVLFVIWNSNLPYKSNLIYLVKVLHYLLVALYIGFTFVYFGIIYKRINRYYKLINNVFTGIKEENTAEFIKTDLSTTDKDGVDCHSLVFLEYNKYKKDFFERKVLVLAEKPIPEIEKNSYVKFITQGNVLVSYEILPEKIVLTEDLKIKYDKKMKTLLSK